MYYEAINEINKNNNIIVCKTENSFYEKIKKLVTDDCLYKDQKKISFFENQNDEILKKIQRII